MTIILHIHSITDDIQRVVLMQCANSLVLVWPERDADDVEEERDIVSRALEDCPSRVGVFVPGSDNPMVCACV